LSHFQFADTATFRRNPIYLRQNWYNLTTHCQCSEHRRVTWLSRFYSSMCAHELNSAKQKLWYEKGTDAIRINKTICNSMCPLILSYLVYSIPQDTNPVMCMETPNLHYQKSGHVNCMIELTKGPAAWFPTSTCMVMFK
jgi:hypothetical protein